MPFEAGWFDLLKIWGPLALGWPVAIMLIRYIMQQNKEFIAANVQLATSLNSLTKAVERLADGKN